MRESFIEYKKNLEKSLMEVNYLYSGDIISSEIKTFCEIKTSPLTLPTFILDSVNNIYIESFNKMFKNSSEIIIPKESLIFNKNQNIYDFIFNKLPFKPSFLFCSEESKKYFGLFKKSEPMIYLPSHWYPIDRYIGLNLDIFYSPMIEESEGDFVFYVVDKAFQSLVWTLQNMDYTIAPIDENNSKWEHKIIYNFYDCQYKAIRVIIRNVSQIRESKIKEILDGD